jgi:pimeloyl-ACP methyl ester carboxylesterase
MEITLPDHVKLHYDKAGSGSPTFIFIHGGGADTFKDSMLKKK